MATSDWRKKLPMWITTSRMVVGLLLFALLALPANLANLSIAILFALSSFTDYLDGHFARKFNAESTTGKFMDPIADKILVLAALIILMQQSKIEPIMVMLILSRDILIGGIRAIAAADQIIIAAKSAGKWKTAIQMVAIPVLFVQDLDPSGILGRLAYWTLWVSVILSLISGWQYTQKYLAERRQQ